MEHRILMADLEQIVTVLNNTTGRNFYIQSAYGQPRLYEAIGPSGGAREVSPRMSKPDLYTWIEAYLDGFGLAYRKIPRGKPVYKFASAHEWLAHRITDSDCTDVAEIASKLATKLDADQIQDLFQDQMDADGYFNVEIENDA